MPFYIATVVRLTILRNDYCSTYYEAITLSVRLGYLSCYSSVIIKVYFSVMRPPIDFIFQI